jgi:predicted O-methyltransferase YrrM
LQKDVEFFNRNASPARPQMNSRETSFTHTDLPLLLQQMAGIQVTSPSAEPTYTQLMLREENKNIKSDDPAFFDQINLDEALQLYSVVRKLKPENTLELGFCCGASGLAILQGLEDNGLGTHHAVDPYQTSYADNMGRRNVSRASLEHRLEFFETFPENVAATLPRMQFAFIDASHLFDFTMLDFVLVDKLLDAGAMLALHDTWMPAIQKVIRFILSNRDYMAVPTSQGSKPSRSIRSRAARAVGRACDILPWSERIFAPEFLTPWRSYDFGNIALLKKVADDRRDWRAFKSF